MSLVWLLAAGLVAVKAIDLEKIRFGAESYSADPAAAVPLFKAVWLLSMYNFVPLFRHI